MRRFLFVGLMALLLVSGFVQPGSAQYYTVQLTYGVNAVGIPFVVGSNPAVLFPPSWAGFTPRILHTVATSFYPWTTMTLTQTVGPPFSQLQPQVTLTNGVQGCGVYANSSCTPINNPTAGFYQITAVVQPSGNQVVRTVIVGGGGATMGGPTQYFRVSGASNGGGYSIGVSVDPGQPNMVAMPGIPSGSSAAAFVAAWVALGALPGPLGAYAIVPGPGGNVFAIIGPPGIGFRFWVGDAAGNPMCQVSGGQCTFNPTVKRISTTDFLNVHYRKRPHIKLNLKEGRYPNRLDAHVPIDTEPAPAPETLEQTTWSRLKKAFWSDDRTP